MNTMTKPFTASRRQFLTGAGALIVSFSLNGKLAQAQSSLPTYRALEDNPDLDSWIRIGADGSVTVLTGKVELGQGMKTALSQVAAEELDVALDRIKLVTADTATTPDQGTTAGSGTMEQAGTAILHASADARHILLNLAAAELGVAASRLSVSDGTITGPGNIETTYWDLVGGRLLRHQVTRQGALKDPSEYTIVGRDVPRVDIPAKVTGGVAYVQDLRLPGMLHGRVVRAPSYGARLSELDDSAAREIPGVVKIVRDGDFLGVIAEREENAIRAMERLREGATWTERPALPPKDAIYDFFLNGDTLDNLIVEGTPTDDPIPDVGTPDEAVRTLTATYYRPYHMHASIGPSCAVAHLEGDRMTMWSHSQNVTNLRQATAELVGLPHERVRVIHMEGAGCYGHNGADDVGGDAAMLAAAVPDRPVRVQWMREDEHQWEPYGSAMVIKAQASLDSDGNVIDWNSDVWTSAHSTRPSRAGDLIAGWTRELAQIPEPTSPGGGRHSSGHRNADPLYTFPQRRIVKHFVQGMPLRISATRGLGAYANVFAIESFVDELAMAAGIDPVEFRLRHLEDRRAREVIQAAAEAAGWQPGQGGDGFGRGIGFAQYKNIKAYAAVVMDVEVDQTTGDIGLVRAVVAGDSGQLVSPDGVKNQLVGGIIQSASWTLHEQVDFDDTRITSTDWNSYPILTFANVPEVETVLINRPGMPYLGTGEATQGPTPAAIANAVFNATGVRLREVPFTPDRVKAALG